MSRPRRPGDPDRWPVPCGRCRQHHAIVAHWPDAGVCAYCYQQAKRTRGKCDCGHEGVLPGRVDDRPACRRCSGVKLNVDCRECGAEDELYSAGKCWNCTLKDTVDRLLINPATGVIAPELVPLADALKSMTRANSGLTWIRQKHVSAFLESLAVAPAITHDTLDLLPNSRTREYVRGLLVEHGCIPSRDELLVRYQAWAEDAFARLSDPDHRDLVRRYVRWHHQRRMNHMERVPVSTFLRSKQAVTVAIDLLNWLTEHEISLAELSQNHLDVWQAEGPTTRLVADSFLRWAIKMKATGPNLSIQRHRRGTSDKLSSSAQEEAVQRIVHTDELTPRDRAAAILVLVFGQQIEDVVELTWDNVNVTDELVTIRLGSIDIAITEPLDGPWRHLAASPGFDMTAAHPRSRWVFRGYSPGRHIDPASLRDRLSAIFSTRAARLGTLHELTKLAPVAVIAEALGYSPVTIERHAIGSAATYAQYVAAAREQRNSAS
jgi:hypothetical protein